MKMRNLVMTAMAVALAGNMTVVMAADGPPRPDGPDGVDRPDRPHGDHHRGPRHKVSRLFNSMDTDGSESIALNEWLVKSTAKAEKHYDRIDSNDDNLITLEEFLAQGPGKRGDRGDDRVLDREAFRECVRETVGEEMPDRAERPDPETAFAEIDANDDGFIDQTELVAAKTARATDHFARIDADADGAITKMELGQALMKHHKQRRTVRDCVDAEREAGELLG